MTSSARSSSSTSPNPSSVTSTATGSEICSCPACGHVALNVQALIFHVIEHCLPVYRDKDSGGLFKKCWCGEPLNFNYPDHVMEALGGKEMEWMYADFTALHLHRHYHDCLVGGQGPTQDPR